MVSAAPAPPAYSDADIKIKEELEALVLQLQEGDSACKAEALKAISAQLQNATSSMTSVPKPLKFLKPLYDSMEEVYTSLKDSDFKKKYADVLSVLATVAPEGTPEKTRSMLKYRLCGSDEAIANWGHEYMRNLSGEIIAEFAERQRTEESVSDLMDLVKQIVPCYMRHNAECDAIDLLAELDTIENIKEHVEENNCQRVVLYLISLANYSGSMSEFTRTLTVTYEILVQQKLFPDALRIAIKLADLTKIKEVFSLCTDYVTKLQLAILCLKQGILFEFTSQNIRPATKRVLRDPLPDALNDGVNNGATIASYSHFYDVVALSDAELETLAEEMNRLISGEARSQHFLLLAKELDVLEPKLPEDVYKTHLEERRDGLGVASIDSAKQNLASTIVNAFVNAGFCNDRLMTVEGSNWIFKNKEYGMLSAAASLGPLLLWNVDEGLAKIDKYQWSQDANVKAGALMAFGLVSSGIRSDCDPAFALLAEQLDSNNGMEKLGAVIGLGFAYGGTQRTDILESIIPIIIDTNLTVECSAMAAVSVGLIYVGSANTESAEAILQTLIERQATTGGLNGHMPRFFCLGLGLLFLGCRDACEPTLSALAAIDHPIKEYACVTIRGFAFAGTGDVLTIQRMLQVCVETKEPKAEEPESEQFHQAAAVLNIPLIAMGEDVGTEMCLRTMDHLLQYAEVSQRRAIPLALALHSISHPRPVVVDTLSKLSHDADADVSLHAIISLGLIGAGTNNSRIAGLLRQLAAYYSKDANAVFVVRIAQGLLYMGKGLLTINPIHSDRFLLNPVALGSLLVVFHALLDLNSSIVRNHHYLLYHLIPAMSPRMLITVDAKLNPLPVPVRVGQAVDTIGQAGKPKTITGFQTHTTPVLLSVTDRAELATEEYIPVSPVMEGVVILEKNPAYNPKEIVQ